MAMRRCRKSVRQPDPGQGPLARGCVATLCLSTGLSLFAGVSVAEDAVRFRFAWPSNVHADVAWTNHVVDDSYGETKDTTYTFRFEIVARPLADGIRIDQRTSLAQGLQSVASLLSSGWGRSIQHWLFFYPSFSVGTDGQFRGLEQVEAIAPQWRRCSRTAGRTPRDSPPSRSNR